MVFKLNIEKETLRNKSFRKVLHTNSKQQVVVMSLRPFEEIGEETHVGISQFLKVEEGSGHAIVGSFKFRLNVGSALVIDPNTKHDIIAGKNGMKLYSIYSKPAHKSDCVQRFKEDVEC
jgi:mannose-6-phosphate isomerase-like protein (cupin superfamily)